MAVSTQDDYGSAEEAGRTGYDENHARVPKDFTETLEEALDGDEEASEVVDRVLERGEAVTVPEVARMVYSEEIDGNPVEAWMDTESYDLSEWKDNDLAYVIARVEDGIIEHEGTRRVGTDAVNTNLQAGLKRAYAEEVGERNYDIGAAFFEIDEFQK
jgi:hypothetical protein